MANTVALSKILHIREKEKIDAQRAYNQSMEFFEEVATKLYKLLKKKEDAEESYESYLQNTTPIERIREQTAYIEILNKQILNLQNDVQKARTDMETKQIKLTDAYTEVKKFEKIMEHRKQTANEIELRRENALMDDLSVQQFISHKKGETDG